MPSTYSTDLKLELMATGENSGTWGTKTNTNLDLVQQAIVGYEVITITANTTLVMTDATISNARNAVLELSGTIAANSTVNVPNIEKKYTVYNNTTGAFTVTLRGASQTTNFVTWSTTDKGIKQVYMDGINVVDINSNFAASSFEQINLPTQNELRFEDASGGQYIAFKAGSTIASNLTFTLPTADGTSGQAITTNGAGTLSFATAGITTGKAIAMAIVFG